MTTLYEPNYYRHFNCFSPAQLDFLHAAFAAQPLPETGTQFNGKRKGLSSRTRLGEAGIFRPYLDQLKLFTRHKGFWRLELVNDPPDFYLAPHHDLPAQHLSHLVYLTRDENLGTSIEVNEEWIDIPSIYNSAITFNSTQRPWHQYRQRQTDQRRQVVMINLVSYETEISY